MSKYIQHKLKGGAQRDHFIDIQRRKMILWLTNKQHGFELRRSTYKWIPPHPINTVVLHDP